MFGIVQFGSTLQTIQFIQEWREKLEDFIWLPLAQNV